MSVHMPMARAFLWQTLARTSTPSLGHKRYRKLHAYAVQGARGHEIRRFSVSGHNKMDEDDSRKVTPHVSFSRRRPLSPLERISRLLPQESLGPEVEQLRDCRSQEKTDVTEDSDTPDASATQCRATKNNICDSETRIQDTSRAEEEIAHPSHGETVADRSDTESGATLPNAVGSPPTIPGESLVQFGEMLIAECKKKALVEYKKIFQLKKGVRLQSSWGTVDHDDIAGRPSGRFVKTTLGMPILVRRPSLEDYVLFMRRGPAITYPKVLFVLITL